jgi:hypothetical protein
MSLTAKLGFIALFLGMFFVGFGFTRPSVSAASHKYGYIVRLVNENGNTFCTGSVVNDHTVVTASHCLGVIVPNVGIAMRGAVEIRNANNDLPGIFATPYYMQLQLDQGLLRGDFKDFEHAETITNPEDILDMFQHYPKAAYKSCGFPLGGDLFCNILIMQERDQFMYKVSGLVLPAMSGGPVTMWGKLFAINIAVEGPDSVISPIYNLSNHFQE